MSEIEKLKAEILQLQEDHERWSQRIHDENVMLLRQNEIVVSMLMNFAGFVGQEFGGSGKKWMKEGLTFLHEKQG
ncbi:MAG: hypothetical protein Q4F10_04765 [Corynebacterium glutamicum]|nr:hypothetical protein [Corynebacterium glutamicum]